MNDPGLKNIARKLRENGFISFQLNLGEDHAEEAEQLHDQVRLDEVEQRNRDERLRDINAAGADTDRQEDQQESREGWEASGVDERGLGTEKPSEVHSNPMDATSTAEAIDSYLDAFTAFERGIPNRSSCPGCGSSKSYYQGWEDALKALRIRVMGK